ncbi:MAG TPA: hypothetical protein PLK82_09010, partial [Bacteroidales bacterium]|nr:hypothetical protein [Bacteroidales bacterium]
SCSGLVSRQGKPADSARTAIYLNALLSLNDNEFADDGDVPVTFPYLLKVEGNGMQTITLTGAIDPIRKMYYLRSELNPAATFGSATRRVFDLVFAPKSRF